MTTPSPEPLRSSDDLIDIEASYMAQLQRLADRVDLLEAKQAASEAAWLDVETLIDELRKQADAFADTCDQIKAHMRSARRG